MLTPGKKWLFPCIAENGKGRKWRRVENHLSDMSIIEGRDSFS